MILTYNGCRGAESPHIVKHDILSADVKTTLSKHAIIKSSCNKETQKTLLHVYLRRNRIISMGVNFDLSMPGDRSCLEVQNTCVSFNF